MLVTLRTVEILTSFLQLFTGGYKESLCGVVNSIDDNAVEIKTKYD